MPRPIQSSRSRDVGETLPKAALRLLSALAEPAAHAAPDPIREGFVSLRGSTRGVSLGRGSHPCASLEDLARRDLVEATGGRGAFTISAAGRARLAREDGRGDGESGDAFRRQHRDLSTAILEARACAIRPPQATWSSRRVSG